MELEVQIRKGEDSNVRRKGDPSQLVGRSRGVPRSGRKEVETFLIKNREEKTQNPRKEAD